MSDTTHVSAVPRNAPDGWGRDSLSEFFDRGRANAYATFVNMHADYARLDAVLRAFEAVAVDWRDPESLAGSLFFGRAQSAFLAASYMATSTQSGEVYPLLRRCIEDALYAHYIDQDEERFAVWSNRMDSDKARAKSKKLLVNREMMALLEQRDTDLHRVVSTLYEFCIDYGAHPNIQSVVGNLRIAQDDNDTMLNNVILTTDSDSTRVALKQSARTGVAVLMVFERIFPDRFTKLGVSPELARLRIGL